MICDCTNFVKLTSISGWEAFRDCDQRHWRLRKDSNLEYDIAKRCTSSCAHAWIHGMPDKGVRRSEHKVLASHLN